MVHFKDLNISSYVMDFFILRYHYTPLKYRRYKNLHPYPPIPATYRLNPIFFPASIAPVPKNSRTFTTATPDSRYISFGTHATAT